MNDDQLSPQDIEDLQKQIDTLETLVKSRMTKEVIQRFGNIKASNPELAVQILALFGQLLQKGKIVMIDDRIFKEVITTVMPKKKEFKFTRK
jgi:DNA-binding TFAR19-related protein (PDSD5 family)